MSYCPIIHAKAYPFVIPDGSYVLDQNGWRPHVRGENDPSAIEGRTPVIASGSNASPDRLAAKYADRPELLDDPIFVVQAKLHDFDSVYSAHVTRYGSIPATLAHVQGTVADVFITWLTDAQLDHMHVTEAVGVNYDFVKLTGIHLLCEAGGGRTTAYAYMSKRGCLNKNGTPVPLAAMSAEGRAWTAMTQAEVLEYARSLIAPHEDTEVFIRQHIDCAETRAARTAQLSADALDHGWGGVTVMGGYKA